MKFALVLLGLLFLGGGPVAGPPVAVDGNTALEPLPHVTSYVQLPDYDAVYNMSTGFDSEIADDIPSELAGHTAVAVTLWMGEWYGWQNPDGVTVNFYRLQGPPFVNPMHSFTIPWAAWQKELVHTGLATVYRITAMLPMPVEIDADMSIGGYVNISWGTAEPFAGLCATPMYTTYGYDVAYLDGENWGYTRWTPISFYTNIPQDFAYELHFRR